MPKKFKSFDCPECVGGVVALSSTNNNTVEYVRGYNVPVPNGILLPICSGCFQIYFNKVAEDKIYPILEKEFFKMQTEHYKNMLTLLTKKHNATERQIAYACGVTPNNLRKIISGEIVASTTLTRLLEAFVNCDAEFSRHLKQIV